VVSADTEILTGGSKEVGLQVNVENTVYVGRMQTKTGI
jgi:hypothetical protein